MTTGVKILTRQMTETYDDLLVRLDGLTDDEFFWEPVPGCWTVFQGADGRWTYQYEDEDPVPSPFSPRSDGGWSTSRSARSSIASGRSGSES